MASPIQPLAKLAEMGGPILILLLLVSVFTLTLISYKLLQYWSANVGRHKQIRQALSQWDQGNCTEAKAALLGASHFMKPVLIMAMEIAGQDGAANRLEAEAEQLLSPLESGFRILDTVAQLAPLLGLLGTVLGMINAFQALQTAGSQVDPSVLAGGIWVALMTTAAGLAVAMPTSIALSWFEARMDNERGLAEHAFSIVATPAARTQATAA